MSILFSHFLSKNNEIRPQEADFTEVLSTIALVSKKLYFYGKLPENQPVDGSGASCENVKIRPKTLAVVGTRKPTKYGEEVAYNLAYAAAKRGAVVVSGLAYGIDSVAHRAALDAGGVTVAVLGTPIDQVYPKAHYRLAEEIVAKGGAVMSELPAGAEFFPKTSFLRRNRLISGLSDAVVVVEAAERSGSLNTAAHALEQGREVYAVPGDITRPQSRGCNRLIQQGAMPYLEPEDVLGVLFPAVRRTKGGLADGSAGSCGDAGGVAEGRGANALAAGVRDSGSQGSEPQDSGLVQERLLGDTEAETKVLGLLRAGVQQGEEIVMKSGLAPAVFNQTMTMLEIKGRVRALGSNRWGLR